jgi:hypothetical protein
VQSASHEDEGTYRLVVEPLGVVDDDQQGVIVCHVTEMGMSTPTGPTVIIRTGPTSPDPPIQVCLLICGDGQPSPS